MDVATNRLSGMRSGSLWQGMVLLYLTQFYHLNFVRFPSTRAFVPADFWGPMQFFWVRLYVLSISCADFVLLLLFTLLATVNLSFFLFKFLFPLLHFSLSFSLVSFCKHIISPVDLNLLQDLFVITDFYNNDQISEKSIRRDQDLRPFCVGCSRCGLRKIRGFQLLGRRKWKVLIGLRSVWETLGLSFKRACRLHWYRKKQRK